jgi:hypothetical protein
MSEVRARSWLLVVACPGTLALSQLLACAQGSGPAATPPGNSVPGSADGDVVSIDDTLDSGVTAYCGDGSVAPDEWADDANGVPGVALLADADHAGTTDDADDAPDSSGDDGAATAGSAAQASPGDLLVTEIMFEPSGTSPQSQWFEVYNTTATPVLLSGLTIRDGWGDSQLVASSPPVLAPPFTYVVLVRDEVTAVVAGVPDVSIVYDYGAGLRPNLGIQLATDDTGDLSLWNGPTQVVDVPYGPWGLGFQGESIELAALEPAFESDSTQWCVAQLPWAAGSDDGTPGLPNDCP